jgi:hypothetical protein
MSKKSELSFSPVVYAILALIIIVVCIAVFFLLIKVPLNNIFFFENKTNSDSNNAINNIDITLGSCKTGDTTCLLGIKYQCNNQLKWEKTQNACK